MVNGVPSNEDPSITFNLAGPANGKKGYYNWDYKDFGPRIAFAYSPGSSSGLAHALFGSGGKTSIRGGFGIVYDRVGAGLLTTFDRYGSFGLSTQLSNAVVPSVATSPRVTDLNTIPTTDQRRRAILPASARQEDFPIRRRIRSWVWRSIGAWTTPLKLRIPTPLISRSEGNSERDSALMSPMWVDTHTGFWCRKISPCR